MNDKQPIIQQLHDAADDRARVDLVLRCPDAVLLKFETAFLNAFRHFEPGEFFVLQRTNAMRAVRSEVGGLPGRLAMELETMRAELAAFAAGAEIRRPAAPSSLDP